MIDNIIQLARSENKSNHELAVAFYKSGILNIKDFISKSLEIIDSDKKMKSLILFGKLTFKRLHKTIYISHGNQFYSEYSHLNIKNKVEEKHISFVKSFLDRILFPQLFLNHQKVSELVFKIKRTDKKALKFPIEKQVVVKIRKILVKSDYRNLLFLLGFDFLHNVYRHYQSLKWFEECSKIESTIQFTNEYFKLDKPILL